MSVKIILSGLPRSRRTDQHFRVCCTCAPFAGVGCDRHSGSAPEGQCVGGLHTARRALHECLAWPALYPRLFAQAPGLKLVQVRTQVHNSCTVELDGGFDS